MTHVDLIRIDWHGQRQTHLGRVSATGPDMVKVEISDQNISATFDGPLYDPESHTEVTQHDADAYLKAIVHKYGNGTYVQATEVHEEDTCKFGWHGGSTDILAAPLPKQA